MPRMVYALARDGFLPRALAAISPLHRTPQAATVFQTIFTLVLAVTGTFEKLAILANVSALALYLGCAAASWQLTKKPLIPLLASGVIVWLLTGLTAAECLGFVVCMVVASAIYFLAKR